MHFKYVVSENKENILQYDEVQNIFRKNQTTHEAKTLEYLILEYQNENVM